MVHGKNHRPIRAQNLGSHGSKGPLNVPNQLTRGPGTWNIDKRTCGRTLEQHGGGWGHLAVDRVGPGATDLPPLQEASSLLP